MTRHPAAASAVLVGIRHVTPEGAALAVASRAQRELARFLPWLQAAQWTGVGRQTVWGKGHIVVTVLK